MKGIGALAAKSAMPKGVTKALSGVGEKSVDYAPPWVSSMVKTLGRTPLHSSNFNFAKLANGASVAKMGSQTKKIYGGEAKETYFKVKTGADNVRKTDWDDIVLTEEPGQTSLTWKNKNYDHGNDQHIVIDHKNKETRFVDDNWSMDAAGEDIVKDDWVEYPLTTNKKQLEKELGVMKGDVDDTMVDYQSVNDMDEGYMDMFHEYVDSFSPSGSIFGTSQRAQLKMNKKIARMQEEEMDWESQFRGGYGMHGYYRGGMVDVLPPLDPQEYAVGGIVKGALKAVPKILGKGKPYMEKLAAPKKTGEKVLDLSKAKPSYTVYDEAGLPIKDFKTEKAARDFLRGDPSANMYKVGKTGQKVKEDAPAMFWRSREEIYQAPQEIMPAQQWLGYLKARGIRPNELDDSSLEPYLRSLGNNKITKKELLKEFDEIAPEMEVIPLGKGSAEQNLNNVYKNLKKMDPDALDPKVGGLIKYLQGAMPNLSKNDKLNVKMAEKVATTVDDYMFKNFGIKDSLAEGIAQGSGVPFKLKYPLVNLASAFNRRGVSFQPKAYAKGPNYSGQQSLGGGDNTQEFLFKYKPGKLRTSEPTYTYAHDFGLPSSARANAFVHVRTSDRTDEFGRRMLFVEEIQSDMHQPIQRALREGSKDGYARRADKIVIDDNMKHLAAIQSRIEEILAVNPKSPALKKLYQEREKVRKIVSERAGETIGGSVPQGPFAKSQDYMEFVSKYLTRVAKDGGYDGVGFSSPGIKNRNLNPTNRDYLGNEAAYGPILGKALKNVEKKSNAKLIESVIMDDKRRPWRIPFLSIKDPVAQETIGKGLPLYKKGGLTKKGR